MTYRLFAAPGAGSAIIEAALQLAGQPVALIHAPPWEESAGRDTLAELNPLREVPTLVLPGGEVMTESAAICLLLAERHPQSGLAPAAEAPERAAFLRWLIFLTSNIYPTFTYGDDPARWLTEKPAQDALRVSTDARRLVLWRIVEDAAASDGPWFLGELFSAIDLFIGVMVHWRPRRVAFAAGFPRLDGIAAHVLARPELEVVWRRNFDQA